MSRDGRLWAKDNNNKLRARTINEPCAGHIHSPVKDSRREGPMECVLCVVPYAEAHVPPVPVDGDALHGPQRVGRRRGERGMRRGSWEELGDGATDVPPCSCPVGAPDGRRNSTAG